MAQRCQMEVLICQTVILDFRGEKKLFGFDQTVIDSEQRQFQP